jgi:RHS repeat-associated protein
MYNDAGPVRSVSFQTVEGNESAPFYVQHYRYFDGYDDTLAAVDQAGATGGQWIVSGAHRVDETLGLSAYVFKPFYLPSGEAPSSFSPDVFDYFSATPNISITRDGLGRPLTVQDYNGNTTQYGYNPAATRGLMVQVQDANQVTGGSHAGAVTQVYYDGHGRMVETDEVYKKGPLGQSGTLVTQILHQPTGEPFLITRSVGAKTLYTRTMGYDALGRLVSNTEPNTNGSGGTGLGWVYAYNDEGQVVGTADARGCGKNITHDSLGRIVSEDYVPCLAAPAQVPYTAPDSVGNGTEAYNVYDPVYGTLMDTYDRAQHTHYNYDGRNRPSTITRWIAVPGSFADLSDRYSDQSFSRSFTYDASNRLALSTTGADAPALTAFFGSWDAVTYTYEGAVQSIGSSYGPLLASQTVSATGSVTRQVLGDVAATEADLTYYNDDSLYTYHLFRAPGTNTLGRVTTSWLPKGGTYFAPAAGDPPTFQTDLANVTIGRDPVGNPMTISDASEPGQWAPGTKPLATQTLAYSDDYRLTSQSVAYGGLSVPDKYVSPYLPEDGSTYPAPLVTPHARVAGQSFTYDWLGNTASETDNETPNVFLDRALGTVTEASTANNGSPTSGPNQLALASYQDPASKETREVNAAYDPAGNLLAWTDGVGSNVSNLYEYGWDEVGRLASATRYDEVTGKLVQEQFTYTAGGQRVVTSRTDAQPAQYTVQVFETLALRDATFSGTAYQDDETTEHVYLPGAHVFYDTKGLPAAPCSSAATRACGRVHVYLEASDGLGSTSFVIDQGTSELVERATYLPYGNVESDFRPLRWGGHRESVRYTGHEDNAEVGLVYFGARYLAPQLQRWVSPDPLAIHGLSADPNPYAFVRGSPMRYVDPFGLDGQDGCDDLSPGCGGSSAGGWEDSGSGLWPGGGGGGGHSSVDYSTPPATSLLNPLAPAQLDAPSAPSTFSVATVPVESASQGNGASGPSGGPSAVSPPTTYSATETAELLSNYASTLQHSWHPFLIMYAKHSSGGTYDFAVNAPSQSWDVPGIGILQAPDFGNYIAGYAAGSINDPLAYWLTRGAGCFYGSFEVVVRNPAPDPRGGPSWKYLGDDAASVQYIDQGYSAGLPRGGFGTNVLDTIFAALRDIYHNSHASLFF